METFVLFSLITLVNIVFVLCIISEQTALIDLSLDEANDSPENFNQETNFIYLNTTGCVCKYFTSTNWTFCTDENKCTNFPKYLQLPSERLIIYLSGINVLKRHSFYNNTQLTELRLEDNDKLQKIEAESFLGLNVLANLTIAHNKNLLSLENGTFKGLNNLTYLKLFDNGFNEFKDFIYSVQNQDLRNLRTLKIGQMQLSEISENTFKNFVGTKIENLFVVTCMLKNVHPKSMNNFKNLKVLNLGENLILEDNLIRLIKEMKINGIDIVALGVENISFKQFPTSLLREIGETKIQQLALNNLKFEFIEQFPYMPNLLTLYMNKVLAFKVDNKTFNNITNLKQLYLQDNSFYNLPQAVSLPKLELLDISNSGKYFSLQTNVLESMENLKFLNLSLNTIRVLDKTMFTSLNSLQTLILRKITLSQINNFTFFYTTNLTTLDLGKNPYFTQSLSEFSFYGLEKLEFLVLDECKIENLTTMYDIFNDLESLTHLNLRSNSIKYLTSQFIGSLAKLEVLDVSFNQLIRYDYSLFDRLEMFNTLKASNNKIEYFTTAMVNDLLNVKNIDFGINPFVCNCKNVQTIGAEYYSNPTLFTKNAKGNKMYCYYPKEYRNQTLYDYIQSIQTELGENCTNKLNLKQNIIVMTFLAFFLLLLICSITVTYIYRYEIRYYVFIIKIFLTKKSSSHSMNKSYNNFYIYDAFVSYCNEDSDFVLALIKNLENNHPYFKLCVYERDFEIGTVISESVLEHVAKSRKTLLIVSEQFIKSQWCRWEVQVAENHTIFFENDFGNFSTDTVIILKIGKIDTKNITPMLKYLMKTRIYLEWENDEKKQQVFWNKLRNSLGGSKVICKRTKY